MTPNEPRLPTTPQALARSVVRTRPRWGPEQVRIFPHAEEAQAKARELARTFPRVRVVPGDAAGFLILVNDCPYLTTGRVAFKPMPRTGRQRIHRTGCCAECGHETGRCRVCDLLVCDRPRCPVAFCKCEFSF